MRRDPPVSVSGVTTVPASGSAASPVPPLFARFVDDTSLLAPRDAVAPTDEVVTRYLHARDGRYGAVVGYLACPVSRLSGLVTALARAAPARPVDLALVVDTGLGAVPKALSMVFSRSALLTPRTVEAAAPPDVDAVWLERVAEFVPEDVLAVIEPRRPVEADPRGTAAWLDAVHRVAEHGCAPRLRCGGRASDVPTADHVEQFLDVVAGSRRGFTTVGLRHAVRRDGGAEHGMLNLVVAVARALAGGDVRDALDETDAAVLAEETDKLPELAVTEVRGLLVRCGAVPEPLPVADLVALGLLDG